MARFRGAVGFALANQETPPGSGVYIDVMVEKILTGDVVKNTSQLEKADKVNFDLNVSNSISIVANAFAKENFAAIRYVKWMGGVWIVPEVTVLDAPRLLLRLGGVYNGEQAVAAGETT